MRLCRSTPLLAVAFALSATASSVGVAQSPEVGKRSVPSSHILHERHEPHWGRVWRKRDRLSSETLLSVRIGLKQSDEILRRGHDRLMDLSDTRSPNYGKHMTAEEVIDFFAPNEDSINAVMDWAASTGIDRSRISLSTNKQWIQFDAPTKDVEDLLYSEYYVWEHASSGSTDISCEEYHVPSHIQEHIDYVLPGIRLRPNKERRGTKTAGLNKSKRDSRASSPSKAQSTVYPDLPQINSTSCNSYIVPECIKTQYGIPNGTTAHQGNQLGVYESFDQHYSTSDLDQYWKVLYPTIPQGTYPQNRLIDGAAGAASPSSTPSVPIGGEADLDFEVAWPLIWPQKTINFQVDDEWYEGEENNGGHGPAPPPGSFNTFLDALDGSYCTYSAYGETGDCTDPACRDPQYPDTEGLGHGGYQGQRQCGVFSPTNVISISYSLPEYIFPAYYMLRQCNEWMKLGLQGVTVVVASGDAGVGTDFNCAGSNFDIFAPYYISTCPYVLSVGATELDLPQGQKPKPNQKLFERVTTNFSSGGGFSNVFNRPSYQSAAVQKYFDTVKLPYSGYKQPVNGSDFSNITSGVYHLGGRGYPDVTAVGQWFPITYAGSWVVVSGTSASAPVWASIITLINEARLAAGKPTVGFINPTLYANPQVFNDITVGNNPGCNTIGFPAAAGWDPASGLGSPNYPQLYKLFV